MNTTLSNPTSEAAQPEATGRSFVRPVYKVDSDEDTYTVTLEMPGVTKDHIHIHFEDRQLSITGRRDLAVPENWKLLHREIPESDYRLRLQVGVDVDPGAVSANFENGVLRLRLPLAESAKPRKIEIA